LDERPSTHSKEVMSFANLGLTEALVRAVADQGYTTPTPIQAQAIPAVLAGNDLFAGAQTGTGKTAGFVLPMLQLLTATADGAQHTARRGPRALIIAPTRELAAQVEASVRTYGKHLKLSSIALYGGVGFGPQAARLKRGVDIVVATPGRLLDHQQQRNLYLGNVEIFVLDEADRMLDMGFIPDVRRIIALLPKQRQTLLFSATFSEDIRKLAGSFLTDPKTIQATPQNSTVNTITQRVHPVDRERKAELLAYLIGRHRWQQVLVFTRTKHGADKLTHSLERDGIAAVALHGNKSQGARTKALADFKKGGVQVMVATDIAARGIDIDQLPHVVNYDLPNVPEDYIHRIGRTGRAGADGEAISLVCVDEHIFLRDIERLIKRPIEKLAIEGFEPDPRARPQSVFAQRGRRAPGSDGGNGRSQGAPRGNSSGAGNGGGSPWSNNGPANGNNRGRSFSSPRGATTGSGNGAANGNGGPRSHSSPRGAAAGNGNGGRARPAGGNYAGSKDQRRRSH
jgi:ATP-dependent RNA helicase RhlE